MDRYDWSFQSFSLGQCPLPAPNSSFLELSNESDEGLVVSPLDDFMTPLHTGMQKMHIVPQQKKRKRINMQCESKPTQRHVYLYIIYYIYIMIHVYHRLLSIFGYFRGLRRKNTSVNSPRFRRWPSPEAASGRRGLM